MSSSTMVYLFCIVGCVVSFSKYTIVHYGVLAERDYTTGQLETNHSIIYN